jgi:hypothetical protein
MPRGGKRPGAGAPKGNLNGFKHGRRSRRLADAVQVLAANPATRETLLALTRAHGQQQQTVEQAAAVWLVNAITRGIKIANPEDARVLAEFIRAVGK